MCTHANPNYVLIQVNGSKYTFPACHVVCCDMEKLEFENWIERVTQPIQTAFQATQLEMNVKDLTAQVTKLTKAVEKTQTKRV